MPPRDRHWSTIVGAVLVVIALLAASALPSESARAQEASSIVVPPHVYDLLAEQGFVDVEVVLAQSDPADATLAARIDGVHSSMANLMAAFEGPALDVQAVYETVPLVMVRVQSVDELNALAQNPAVVDIGKTTMIAQAAAPMLQPASSSATTSITGAYTYHSTGNLGQGLTVAVLDSGVDTDHVDLVSSISYEACFLRTAATPCPDGNDRQMGPGSSEDDFGHGTAVSGIISSDGIVSPMGAAPGVSLEVYKVLGATGTGSFDEILAALDHINAFRTDVDIVNISVASNIRFPGPCDVLDGAPVVAQMRTVIRDLQARGVIVVAATGNSGDPNGMSFPACVSEVVSTAASQTAPVLAPFSNVSVLTDVAAPGTSVRAAAIGGGEQELSGTSFAAPLVSACLALYNIEFLSLGFSPGGASASATLDRLINSPLDVSGTTFPVPWLNCYRRCDAQVPDRMIAWDLDGTALDDVIIGTTSSDIIFGNGGTDTICGSGGGDLIIAGEGADQIFGDEGADVIFGNGGNDTIVGGPAPDRLHGGSGRDFVYGGGGQDRIFGDGGSDFLYGQDQSDRIYGGSGDDLIDGAAGKDSLYGEGGDDHMFGGVNTDYFDGGAGFDFADGGLGWDRPLVVDVSGCRSIEQRVSC